MSIELECGEFPTAKKIADKSAQMVTLFEMWKYSAFTAPLEIAFAEKDADKCICILREMLAAMREPWKFPFDFPTAFGRIPHQAESDIDASHILGKRRTAGAAHVVKTPCVREKLLTETVFSLYTLGFVSSLSSVK